MLRAGYLVLRPRAAEVERCSIRKAAGYMERKTGRLPPLVDCTRAYKGGWVLFPRHYALERFGPPTSDTRTLAPAKMVFTGTLRPNQGPVVKKVIRHLRARTGGVLVAACGMGKTTMALAVAAALGQKTLVIVHKHVLVDQWCERIGQFLGPGAPVDIVTAQSLHRKGLEGVEYGLTIMDEAHHVPARTFAAAVGRCPARYRLALTATPTRTDGLIDLLHWHFGKTIVKLARKTDATCEKRLVVLKSPHASKHSDFTRIVNGLAEDAARNRMLAAEIKRRAAHGRVLVLTARVAQAHALAELVGSAAGVITGKTKKKHRAAIIEGARVLVCSTGVASEGFDARNMDCLVFATPCGTKGGSLEQCVGRILRGDCAGLAKTVVDVEDSRVGMLQGMGMNRRHKLKRMGFLLIK